MKKRYETPSYTAHSVEKDEVPDALHYNPYKCWSAAVVDGFLASEDEAWEITANEKGAIETIAEADRTASRVRNYMRQHGIASVRALSRMGRVFLEAI